jgi:4-hydroxybenzoate polyprenyltransferase and related prenyltransferases
VPLAPRLSPGGLIRLVHPFPILLDGIATGAVALLAGGEAPTAVRLGAAMVALQASIGILNDLVDAPFDAGRKPGKPIPAGLVSPVVARAVMVAAAGIGLVLVVPFGSGLVAVAGVGLAIGYGYDLVAKGTTWSWLPFAVGIPLLPVFGWYGAVGSLPAPFAILLPEAVMAGAALAIANARADMDRDQAAGLASVAVPLGSRGAWTVGASLLAVVAAVALGSLWLAGAPSLPMAASIGAVFLLGAGVVLGREVSSVRLERAWEVQAVGVAVLGATWLWGIGRLG